MKVSAILAGGILPVALAAPSSTYILREERGPLESHWAKGDAAHDATIIPARIALKQSNVEKGEALIADM
ncbi:hypothetical protein NLG97_g5835 [Lecanicillium saksenae]|uniref:Uncharacterized protein n=1 Tax=Lecanicillium saksenae TaxID=468837 RepID=A0ACC1QT18_9HYPO|nr:hypothetical protein NLG97_g5835 [Lecanicillium saksenae]